LTTDKTAHLGQLFQIRFTPGAGSRRIAAIDVPATRTYNRAEDRLARRI
jgi:hypothetical protein